MHITFAVDVRESFRHQLYCSCRLMFTQRAMASHPLKKLSAFHKLGYNIPLRCTFICSQQASNGGMPNTTDGVQLLFLPFDISR